MNLGIWRELEVWEYEKNLDSGNLDGTLPSGKLERKLTWGIYRGLELWETWENLSFGKIEKNLNIVKLGSS